MPSENKIKLALLFSLGLALLAYHGMEIAWPLVLDPRLMQLAKVAQVVVTAFLFLGFLYWPPFVKLLLGQNYIGGIWEGESEIQSDGEGYESSHQEKFEVQQSVFQTTLTGRSWDAQGKVVSIWTARLYRVEGMRYWFAMELNTTDAEVGVLQFSKSNDQLDGLYHPGNPKDSRVFRFSAKRSTV